MNHRIDAPRRPSKTSGGISEGQHRRTDAGEDGITARDILEYLPSAVRSYREDHGGVIRDFYNTVQVI